MRCHSILVLSMIVNEEQLKEMVKTPGYMNAWPYSLLLCMVIVMMVIMVIIIAMIIVILKQ